MIGHRHPHRRPRTRWGMLPLGLRHGYPPCCVLAFVLRCRRVPAQAKVLGVRCKGGDPRNTYVACGLLHRPMWTWDEHKALCLGGRR